MPVGRAARGPMYDTSLDEGNFKRGATKPIAIVVGIALALGLVAAIVLGLKSEDKMTVDQVAKERKDIEMLPVAEQLPRWRKWATESKDAFLQMEAMAHLAWVKDPEGMQIMIKNLAHDDHRIRGTAAQALLEYGSPTADAAKPALMKALTEADDSDKPQICWALAMLHAGEAFDTVLVEYRAGRLAKVQKLDQNPAFDPDVMASMVSLDRIASLAGDESESVRMLVATTLSADADPKWTSTLIKLVQDPSVEVAREAAVGLGKIANEQAMAPLLGALMKADKDSRAKFLEALRDGIGANGLILALQSVSHETYEREKFQTKQIFDMLRELEDPRGGDFLVKYIESNPRPHWKTEAALRLAEVGDLRAIPTLAWRMRQDPTKLYNDVDDHELRTDDNERVVGARMLADLAILYPDQAAKVRSADDDVMFWLKDHPQPHANGLRFLAAAGATEDLAQMRVWADPKVALPKEGQQDLKGFDDWATAQSALRYLGWMRDAGSWGLLQRQLFRRPAKVDATMDSLMQGGLAVLGMTLRALGVGAAHGFAQWGDARAYPDLVKYVEEPLNNEQSRLEACFSLSWVATDDEMKEVVRKVHEYNKPDPKSFVIRGCYLETLIHRPVPEATAGLLDLLRPDVDLEVRHQAARAIGFGGVTKDIAQQLFDKLKDVDLHQDAALALLIGADSETAARSLASYNEGPPEALEQL